MGIFVRLADLYDWQICAVGRFFFSLFWGQIYRVTYIFSNLTTHPPLGRMIIYEIEKIKDRRKRKEKGENGGREENIWENKSKICPKNCEKFTDMLHVPKKM